MSAGGGGESERESPRGQRVSKKRKEHTKKRFDKLLNQKVFFLLFFIGVKWKLAFYPFARCADICSIIERKGCDMGPWGYGRGERGAKLPPWSEMGISITKKCRK